MKKRPKISLGFAVALFFLLFAIIFIPKKPSGSQFQLTAQQNSFHLDFDLHPEEIKRAEKFIEKLALPNTLMQGVEFELDATTSAMLNFAAPVKGTFNPTENALKVNGQIKRPLKSKTFSFQSFNLPQDLNLAISSTNLQDAATNYLDLPSYISQSVSQNAASQPQYLAMFGNSQVYIFETGTFDTASLKDLGDGYKEEQIEGVSVSIFKNVTIFEVGQRTYIASSLDAAKIVLDAQKNPNNSVVFPTAIEGNFALLFINSQSHPAPESLLIKVFGSENKIPNSIKQVSKVEFTLKDTTFSASISTH